MAVVCDGSMPAERTVFATLGTLGEAVEANAVRAPAIIVVGEVVRVAHPERSFTVDGYTWSRSPTPPTRGSPTTATCATSSLRKHLEAEHGLFLAEGEKVVRRAVEAGFAPRSFLMAPRWLDGLADVLVGLRRALLRRLRGAGRAGHRLPRAPRARWPRCAVRRCPRSTSVLAGARSVLVLEDIVDHTNVGAIFRSGAALGFDAVLLSPRCADPLYRRSIKVAMGAVFTLPWTRLASWETALPTLSAAGFTTVALTLAPDAVEIEEAVRGLDKVALVLGGEGHGLSPRWEAAADRRAIIPMAAGIDSLNVAAATAVACYVTARR